MSHTRNILIVDDEPQVVRALEARCQQLGLTVHKAYNALDAMKVLSSQNDQLDLLLVDWSMPGADGLTLIDMIRLDTQLSPLPAILLTGYDNPEARQRCESLGVHYVFKDVNAWQKLEPLIVRLVGIDKPEKPQTMPVTPTAGALASESSNNDRKKVLVIDDDPAISKTLKIRLEASGFAMLAAYAGMQGYWMALKEDPGLIILDYKMPGGWGNTILGKLKSNPITREIPVIILSGMTDVGIQRDILRLGAESWINKPFDVRELIETVQRTIR